MKSRLLKVSDGDLVVHRGHLFLRRVKADDAGEYECRDKAATGRVVLRVDSAASEAESSNTVKEDDAAHDEEDLNAIEEQAQLFVFVMNETIIELRGDRRNATSIDNRCTAYARSSNGRLFAPDQVAWYDPHGQVFAWLNYIRYS